MNQNQYETTLFFIKPPAVHKTTEVLKELRNHFDILSLSAVELPKEFWLEFHNDDPLPYRDLNAQYLANKLIVMGIVGGINAKEKLLDVCGQTYDGSKCSQDTIRHKYKDMGGFIKIDGFDFYINAIHRSMPEDSEKEINIYLSKVTRNPITSYKSLKNNSFNASRIKE